MNMLGARKDTKQNATEAIVGIREQLAMLDKKEEYLTRLIDEQHNKAKKNATTNKAGKLNRETVGGQVAELTRTLSDTYRPSHLSLSSTPTICNTCIDVQRPFQLQPPL